MRTFVFTCLPCEFRSLAQLFLGSLSVLIIFQWSAPDCDYYCDIGLVKPLPNRALSAHSAAIGQLYQDIHGLRQELTALRQLRQVFESLTLQSVSR